MKIAIVSDLHLGYERFSDDAYEQANAALQLAAGKADAILLPGDIFDARVPKPETLSQAFTIFRALGKNGWGAKISSFTSRDNRACTSTTPVIVIPGTHEMRPKGLVNPIQVLETIGFVVNAQSATVILEKGGEKVAVFGFGGVPEKLAKDAIESLNPLPVPGAFNIFMFHQSISEFVPARDDILSAEDLPKGFDLYVCGHLHQHAEVECCGKPLLIPGSTVLTQLKPEETKGKGFFIFDTKAKSSEFFDISSRPFIFKELEFNSATPDEIEKTSRAALVEILSKTFKKPPVIRLMLRGSLKKGFSATDISLARLSEDYSGKALIFFDKSLSSEEFKDKIERIRSLREGSRSVRELGIELLREKLERAGLKLGNGKDAAYLFDLFSDGKKDAAAAALEELLKG